MGVAALIVSQLRMYQRLANGETTGPVGRHDDCVMALALSWQGRKQPWATAPQRIELQWR